MNGLRYKILDSDVYRIYAPNNHILGKLYREIDGDFVWAPTVPLNGVISWWILADIASKLYELNR